MPSSWFSTWPSSTPVEEHWTVSGQSVVLSGPRDRLWDVADQLDVDRNRVITMTPTRAVLALWGASLAAYQQRGHDASSTDASSLPGLLQVN